MLPDGAQATFWWLVASAAIQASPPRAVLPVAISTIELIEFSPSNLPSSRSSSGTRRIERRLLLPIQPRFHSQEDSRQCRAMACEFRTQRFSKRGELTADQTIMYLLPEFVRQVFQNETAAKVNVPACNLRMIAGE